MSAVVTPDRRYTRWHPCPICGGHDSMKRGQGERCAGMLSEDGQWALCTREECAGDLPINTRTAVPGAWHKLASGGETCRCGHAHGAHLPAIARQMQAHKQATPPEEPKRTHLSRPPDHIFTYQDADGTARFRVLRYNRGLDGKSDKAFIQQRPDGAGDWVNGLDGIEPILLDVPDLQAADPRMPVIIVEGELKARKGKEIGLLTTTCAGGAGKWRAEYGELLRGRHVIILPDNDPERPDKPHESRKGQRHAAEVATMLAGVAASVRVVELPGLPDKGDLADWIQNGGTVAELYALALTTPAYMPSAQETTPAMQDASMGNENAPACLSCARLKDQLRIADTSLANLRRERAIENHFLAVPNERMSAPEKLAYLAVRRELSDGTHEHNRDGQANIPRAFIARRIGVKEQAAGAHLLKLKAKQVIAHNSGKVSFDEAATYIGRGALFDTPEAVQAPERANTWGGARKPRCAACNSEHLKPHTYVCEECGTISSAADAIAAGVSYDLGQVAQSQETTPAMQDASFAPEAEDSGDAGDTISDAHDTPTPEDRRVTDLVSLGEMSTASQHSAAPACPHCGESTRPSKPFPGRWVCFPCGKLLDELATLAATG